MFVPPTLVSYVLIRPHVSLCFQRCVFAVTVTLHCAECTLCTVRRGTSPDLVVTATMTGDWAKMVQVCSMGKCQWIGSWEDPQSAKNLVLLKKIYPAVQHVCGKNTMSFYGKSSNVMDHGFDSNQFSEKVWASAKPTGVGFKHDEICSLLQWNLHNIDIQDSIYSRWTMNLPKNEQFLVGGLEHLFPYIGNSSPN